jgi:hypothetical protein
MRTRISVLAALIAAVAIGAGIGVAHGASSGNATPEHLVVAPSVTPTHATAQVLFAVVKKNGQLSRGLGVLSSGFDAGGPGTYRVLFKRGVSKCAYVATLGKSTSSGLPPQGSIGVVGLFQHKAGVFVETVDSTGSPTNDGFHLVVTCPPL